MSVQTVTIYPASIVSSSSTVQNPNNILGYSTASSASNDGASGLDGTITAKFASPGFSGGEELVEVRLFVECYRSTTLTANETSVASSSTWYYNNGGTSVGIRWPPGYYTNVLNWASTVYNVSGAVRTNVSSTSTSTDPWGTYDSRGNHPDPYLSIANAAQWNTGMEVGLVVKRSGYTSRIMYMRRARIEIDYLPGNLVRVKDAGIWKDSAPYAKDAGVWKEGAPFVKDAGIWKPTV